MSAGDDMIFAGYVPWTGVFVDVYRIICRHAQNVLSLEPDFLPIQSDTVVDLRYDFDAKRYRGQCPDCGKRWYAVRQEDSTSTDQDQLYHERRNWTEADYQRADEVMFHRAARQFYQDRKDGLHISCFSEQEANAVRSFFGVNYPDIPVTVSWLRWRGTKTSEVKGGQDA